MLGGRRCLVLAVSVVALLEAGDGFAQPMTYEWSDGQKFSYNVAIEVDAPDAKTTYKGIIHYTVAKGGKDQSNVNYRGGLKESKVSKRTSRGGFPGGPRGGFPGPPSFPSPFSRPTFAGKTQTTNKITLTSRGKTLAMTGDSQLPYLLGNLSLIPFETLPEGDQKKWSVDSGISITEESDNDRGRFSPFGRFGPFGGNSQESKQAGGEVSNYVVTGNQGDLVTVNKTYKLFTPKAGGKDVFEMSGKGTWTFDRAENVPHACDMNLSLVVKSDNTTTTVPIVLKYDRISAEKLAAMELEAKQKADEAARLKAEAKEFAETPLTPAEKESALTSLRSGNSDGVHATLVTLAKKALKDPDPSIAAAIEPLLSHGDKKIADAAHNALVKWSPSYAKKKSLAKAYRGPSPVKSTGLVVESITPLYVGQLVQAQRPRRGSFWRAGRIKELMPDGTVKIAFLTWGKENDRDIVVVQRRSIQLAPPELEQPSRPSSARSNSSAGTGSGVMRTWSDSTGRFNVDATFVGVQNGKVNLRRVDGRTMSIPFEKLSKKDQDYVDQQSKSENPFQLN